MRIAEEKHILLFFQVLESSHISLPLIGTEVSHHFSPTWCSKNIELENNNSTAIRSRNFTNALVFASSPLWYTNDDDAFEIRIDEVCRQWSGSLKFGVATLAPQALAHAADQSNQSSSLIPLKDISTLRGDVYWLEGNIIKHNSHTIRLNYAITSLDRLVSGDKLAVRRLNTDGSLRFSLNGEDCGVAVFNVPKKLFPVVELYGSTVSVSVVSVSQTAHPSPAGSLVHRLPSMNTMLDSLEVVLELGDEDDCEKGEKGEIRRTGLEFHDNHGRNVQLSDGNATAIRTDSYNQGFVITNRSLKEEEVFEVRLDRLNNRWTSSLMIGALFEHPDKIHLPITALGLKKNAIVISGDTLFQNGHKMEAIGPNLDKLTTGQKVGLKVDGQRNLKILVNGVDHGTAVKNVPAVCYGIIDLYGQCEQVSIVRTTPNTTNAAAEEVTTTTTTTDESSLTQTNSILTSSESDAAATMMAKEIQLLLVVDTVNNPIILRPLQRSKCDYLKLCSRFEASLSIPTHFFGIGSSAASICYCLNCVKMRGDDLYVKKGNPPRDYATPVNWVRFPLRASSNVASRAEPSTESWHTAFHGTKSSFIRKILDHGELVPLVEFGLAQKLSHSRSKESKEDDSDTTQLVFSPTLSYFLKIPQSCEPCQYQDRKTEAKFKARLAFEVDIHPGSYKIGPPSQHHGGGQGQQHHHGHIDPHFKLDETEWLTKEKGNTAIKALLVNLELVTSSST